MQARHRRARALVIHPVLDPIGGGEVVAAWTIQTLARNYDVDVLTWNAPDFEALDRCFGTSLQHLNLKIFRPPRTARYPADIALRLDRDPWSIQRYAILMQMTKWIRHSYDVVMTTYNEADLGGPAIQYVHNPWCGRLDQQVAAHGAGVAARARAALKVWLCPWRLVSGFSFDRKRTNLTLANSDWTGNLVRRFYAIDTETVHPPVPGELADTPWSARENGFVCVGRLVPYKGLDRILTIVDLFVRRQGKARP